MKFSFAQHLLAAIICVLVVMGASFCGRAQPPPFKMSAGLPSSAVPPNPTVSVQLPRHVYMHFLLLPLGRIDGSLVGQAQFEPRGHRAAFLATFSGATIGGDWQRLNPVQAFVFDPGSRMLTALATAGDARSVRWLAGSMLLVHDAAGDHRLDIGAAAAFAPATFRMTTPNDVTLDDVIGAAGDGRLLLARNSAGRFATLQVGARALRFEGVCADGAYALSGNYVVWVDQRKTAGAPIGRSGPDMLAPPSFAGSAFGDAIAPVLPLGHSVYQGTYRSGTAYFAFTYGMQRIVAATHDVLAFGFPRVPAQLVYTVGDGFGADNNGHLYFARPESDQILYWRNGRYVREALHFPVGNGRVGSLFQAMQIIASQDPLWPPLRPGEDALDDAMLVWRVYPVGDSLGQRWIASYLGHVMLSDTAGNFSDANAPRFPFAVLGRTDDGRLWGAAPLTRSFDQRALVAATSALWWTRDGLHWHNAGVVPGDAGAVGLNHNAPWVALTQSWFGHPAIALVRLGDASAQLSGGTYAGEQLFFAELESGFYLVWGATPGRRLDSQQGTLSAYRVDSVALQPNGSDNTNVFTQQLVQPAQDPSLPPAEFSVADAQAIVQPSLQALHAVSASQRVTLATNVAGIAADSPRMIVLSLAQERAYEIKYAARPYPLATVEVTLQANGAVVRRVFERGQLSFDKRVERWTRDDGGQWRRAAVLSHSSSNL